MSSRAPAPNLFPSYDEVRKRCSDPTSISCCRAAIVTVSVVALLVSTRHQMPRPRTFPNNSRIAIDSIVVEGPSALSSSTAKCSHRWLQRRRRVLGNHRLAHRSCKLGSVYLLLDLQEAITKVVAAIPTVRRQQSPALDLRAGTHTPGRSLRTSLAIIPRELMLSAETILRDGRGLTTFHRRSFKI